jgi:hypothetical protein
MERKETIERFSCLFHYRHIKHLGPDRFNIDRTIGQVRNKEQSRSLPRIPISVCDFFFRISKNFIFRCVFLETKYQYKSRSW